ncbi:MAG: HAMP domain-containing protein [Pirellulales bacterium]|nr:HAMP domain-containing protein [Pirellulales bacterium]
MKIFWKLTLGTCLLAVLIGVVGFYAASVSREALQRTCEDTATQLATEVLADLNRSLRMSVDDWHVYTASPLVQRTARESNRRFDGFYDIQAHLNQEDELWQNTPKDRPSPLMRELMSNELAVDLRKRIEAIARYHEYESYGEAFVTNRYGANIAQTSRTFDFRQDDEAWWQLAMNDGAYLGKLRYDRSAKVYSNEIAVRIDDEDGKPLGVVKAVHDVESTIAQLASRVSHDDDTVAGSDHSQFVLLNTEGQIIHSTWDPSVGLWSNKAYPYPLNQEATLNGTLIFQRDDPWWGRILASCAFSNKALGWILVVENRADEVLAPARRLRNSILAMAAGIAALGTVLGLALSLSVSRRLARLRDAAVELGKGDLTTRIKDSSSDEIGQLGTCFNELAVSLHNSRQEVAGHLSALELNNEALEEVNRRLELEVMQRNRTEVDLWRSEWATQRVLDSLPVGVMVIGRDKIVRQVNPAALKMMGCDSADEVVGWACHSCFRAPKENCCPILDLNEKVENLELTLLRKDGTEIPIRKTVLPIRLGNEDVLLETFVDLSNCPEKQAVLQLNQSKAEEAD